MTGVVSPGSTGASSSDFRVDLARASAPRKLRGVCGFPAPAEAGARGALASRLPGVIRALFAAAVGVASGKSALLRAALAGV
eukprot:5557129-Pyramimonas_sp.AAC.1